MVGHSQSSANVPPSGTLDGKTGKYIVTKADGSPMDPDARYLVLRVDGEDRHAERTALRSYIASLRLRGEDALAAHLESFFAEERALFGYDPCGANHAAIKADNPLYRHCPFCRRPLR